MDCFLVVSTNAFKTTDGSAVEMSDFYEELDYRLNRISGPSFLWYVEYIKDEEIHIYYRHSGPSGVYKVTLSRPGYEYVLVDGNTWQSIYRININDSKGLNSLAKIFIFDDVDFMKTDFLWNYSIKMRGIFTL